MGKIWSLANHHLTKARLYPISPPISVVGEPYWGKPDVRFDEGDQRTSIMAQLVRHRQTKGSANG